MRWVAHGKVFACVLLVIALLGCEEGPFRVSVRYDTLGELKPKAPVYFDKTPIGHVEQVVSTDDGKYLVELAIDPGHKDAMTVNAKFFIVTDPLDDDREAVMVRQDPPGGAPLKEGATVQGEKRQGFFGQLMTDLRASTEEAKRQWQESLLRLQESLSQNSQNLGASMEKSLEDLEHSFQEFSNALESPVTDQDVRQMQEAVDTFIAQFKSLTAELQAKLRDEVLPELRRNLENFRKRLEEQGRQDDADKVDRQIDQLMTI